MGLLFRLIELLVLIAPVVGVIYAGIRALSSHKRQQNEASGDRSPTDLAGAESHDATTGNQASRWRAIRRAIDAHDQTDARWLEYEIDPAKLLDFPVMTDMRDPLTTAFHKAKLSADFHRPLRAEDLLNDREGARQYLDAVESYVTAFNAAEAEARRRGRNDFSREERQRLARAQNLLRVAADTAATPQERQRAYGLARTELDGLLVLPDSTRASIERGIIGEIDG
ncbi:hypothetical protein MSIMFB_02771 [Mycobacterium simulans]|uniref:Uncharacterized protein n=1 Tax=Mycobacterium simulans TaxID=627089 RepID=A0A7Z7NAV1_9MYCO|nr:hypothetical protein [Mycobacterium simulans]SOJ55282.1 hypothetical protein MSIMFB_02771 [Mycobacterium simulans]